MIQHVWTVVCSRAVVDRYSNNVSLQNVLERIEIHDKPKPGGTLPIGLDVASMWTRVDPSVPTRGKMRATFRSPSGAVTQGPFELDIDVSEAPRHRTRGHFASLNIEESGRYTFRVELQQEDDDEWHEVAVVPLDVTFREEQNVE